MSGTTKAAAWAVFQHHGGSSGNYNRIYGLAVRRPTRFKIEAQMKSGGRHGVATTVLCSSSSSTANNLQWDAGSTLFDSYELDSLSKQFDQAFLLPSSRSAATSPPEEPLPARITLASIDETHPVVEDDTTLGMSSSPFSRQLAAASRDHHARGVFLPSLRMMRDCAEDAYNLVELQHHGLQPIWPNSSTHETTEETTSSEIMGSRVLQLQQQQPSPDESSSTLSVAAEEEIEDTLLKNSFQFAHTPNPLNLSQRRSRRSQDKSSALQDPDGTMRQSFQERLRSFFHKARISPHQDSSSTTTAHKDSHRRGRKSYTSSPGDSLSHYGWSYVDEDHNRIPEELSSSENRHRRRLLAFLRKMRAHKKRGAADPLEAEPPAAATVAISCDCHKLSKHTKGERSFSLLSVSKALQSLPHHYLGGGASSELGNRQQQQEQGSSVSEHEHHHVYHHHHHHVVMQQQQKDYELTLQDIDRRVLRKSFEEKARRISMEEHGSSSFKVPRNSLEEIREHH
ncbi:unnamed protein product [Sphagnum troendelagicum]